MAYTSNYLLGFVDIHAHIVDWDEWNKTTGVEAHRRSTTGEKRKVAEKASSFHRRKPIQSHQYSLKRWGNWYVLGPDPIFHSSTLDHCSDPQFPFLIETRGGNPISAESQISISACDQSSEQQLQRKHECSLYWTTSVKGRLLFLFFLESGWVLRWAEETPPSFSALEQGGFSFTSVGFELREALLPLSVYIFL